MQNTKLLSVDWIPVDLRGVWEDERVLTGFCCAACPIESWPAWWISHGLGGGVLDEWVDG